MRAMHILHANISKEALRERNSGGVRTAGSSSRNNDSNQYMSEELWKYNYLAVIIVPLLPQNKSLSVQNYSYERFHSLSLLSARGRPVFFFPLANSERSDRYHFLIEPQSTDDVPLMYLSVGVSGVALCWAISKWG
jgi:hypothetical protein